VSADPHLEAENGWCERAKDAIEKATAERKSAIKAQDITKEGNDCDIASCMSSASG
jgi:hypothetical protein